MESKLGPTCQQVWTVLQRVHTGACTEALRSGAESDGEGKRWFGWSKRRDLPEQVLDCPCLAPRNAPTFHPHLPPQNANASSQSAQISQVEGQQ